MKKQTKLLDLSENYLVITFKGEFFDKPIPSIILEKQLVSIKRYAKENSIKEEDILVKITDGSLLIELAAGATIITLIINLLSKDYSKVEDNLNSLTSAGKGLVSSLLEPVKDNRGSKIIFTENEEKIKELDSSEAEEILKFISDDSEKKMKTLRGSVFGIRKDSKFSFSPDDQPEEIQLSFSGVHFKDTEEIRSQFNEYVEIKGLANINKNGVITSMNVEEYKKLEHPQQSLNIED